MKKNNEMNILTNALAGEYLELKKQQSEIEKRLAYLSEFFKTTGTTDTPDYAVVVSDVEREQLANLAKVSEVFGRQVLDKHGLVNKIVYKTVKVSEKTKKAAKSAA
jgi:hypothetical protein